MIYYFQKVKREFNAEFGIRNAELMVATLRICNSACCLEMFSFLWVIDISATFWDVWEPVPYGMFVVLYNYSFIGKV